MIRAYRGTLPKVAASAYIDPSAQVIGNVTVGERSSFWPGAVARGDVHSITIGDETNIQDNTVLHCDAPDFPLVIGNRVILQNGVVVGGDGFGFATESDGTHVKIPQEADVVIEDDVEIGSNSTIDRPAVGETRIAAGTKIDNLVHVAHGVAIGKRVLLAAQTGIAGSTVVEDDVMMAGQAGVTGHIRIGRGAKVGAKSAVLQSVDAGGFVTGHPAIDHADWRKASVVFRQLPVLKKRIEELEQRIAELEEKLAKHP